LCESRLLDRDGQALPDAIRRAMLALIGYPFRLMSFLSRLEQRFITLADQPGAIYDNRAGYSQQRDANHQRPQAELKPATVAFRPGGF
jgi:hypothetical protein